MRRSKAPSSLAKSPSTSATSSVPVKAEKRLHSQIDSHDAPEPEAKKQKLQENTGAADQEKYFSVMFYKFTKKKNKTFDDEGTLVVRGQVCFLYDTAGELLGKTSTYMSKAIAQWTEGTEVNIAGRVAQISGQVSSTSFEQSVRETKSTAQSVKSENNAPPSASVSATAFIAHNAPLHRTTVAPSTKTKTVSVSEHDLVLNEEPVVVLDPYLAKKLRPHQREGVKFMYDCVMGKTRGGEDDTLASTGCVLADAMGLGKTLQAISLVYTLMKQSNHPQKVAKKTIIVTPSTLVKNWVKEIKFWLSMERLSALWISEKKKSDTVSKLNDFVHGLVHHVLVISYEQVRQHIALLSSLPLGLLICDEGHRIKNTAAKTTQALLQLNCKRRIILSGTPYQNNMAEFYTVIDFVNPDALGTYQHFRSTYETPLHSPKIAAARKQELAKRLFQITSPFILRRGLDVLKEYLPNKTERVLFIQPSALQREVYDKYVHSSSVSALLESLEGLGSALAAITTLKKLCNHPILLHQQVCTPVARVNQRSRGEDEEEDADEDEDTDQSFRLTTTQFEQCVAALKQCKSKSGEALDDTTAQVVLQQLVPHSNKFVVLAALLQSLRVRKEKIVIASNYTKTLDLLEALCRALHVTFRRLDGSTDITVRQTLVDQFQSEQTIMAFLLSTKAGGQGINLFAANHLVLFDCDWNPAYDLQTTARIWREGQKRETQIYRFLLAGTIEEKIFQRQLMKQTMSRNVIDDDTVSESFSQEDLKKLFDLLDTPCETHDISGCTCLGNTATSQVESRLSEVAAWTHHPSLAPGLLDSVQKIVNFVFSKSTK
jgi:SNF2 family DNA or RNA helicase